MVRQQYCKAEAARLRADWSVVEPPVCPEMLAGKLFLTVHRKRPWQWRSRSLLRREVGEIWVNGAEGPRPQRFSVGHELGHFLLHPDANVFSAHADMDSADYAADPDKELEDEADYFSSVLLAPPEWLRRDVEAGMMPPTLVERYNLSSEVIFIALKQYRLLNKLGRGRRR